MVPGSGGWRHWKSRSDKARNAGAKAKRLQSRNEASAMQKHPPAPIHIRIDTQEQRSGIPALLAAMPQVHIELTPLRTGDYEVGGDHPRGFQRRPARHFPSSLLQGS